MYHQPASMEDLETDYPLLGDLRETFLAAGGLQEDWDDLVHGLHHPQWALDWTDSSSPSHAKRLEDLGASSLAAGNLIEYEVRETSNGSVTGLAIGLIKVYRQSRGHISLEIKHLSSTDDEFSDWAAYHINEDVSFHLHLCKKPPGSCTSSPSSKKLGWLHVSRFRLTTFVSALGPDYSSDAILDGLRERVEALVGTFSPPGDSKVELRPREDDRGGRAGEVEEGRHKDPQKGRVGPPVGYKAAMGAATAKAGEVPKKRTFVPGPGGDQRKKDERGHDVDKSGEAMRAKNAAQQASRALMGGHPQMVLVEGRERRRRKVWAMVAISPGWTPSPQGMKVVISARSLVDCLRLGLVEMGLLVVGVMMTMMMVTVEMIVVERWRSASVALLMRRSAKSVSQKRRSLHPADQ